MRNNRCQRHQSNLLPHQLKGSRPPVSNPKLIVVQFRHKEPIKKKKDTYKGDIMRERKVLKIERKQRNNNKNVKNM